MRAIFCKLIGCRHTRCSSLPSRRCNHLCFKMRERCSRAAYSGWQEHVPLGADAEASRNYRNIAQWMTAHSRYAMAEKNDAAAAAEDWLMIFALSRQVSRSPFLVNRLDSMAIDDLAASEILLDSREQLGPLSSTEFIKAVRASRGSYPSVHSLWEGERIYAQSLLDACFVREGRGWLDVATFVGNQHRGGRFGVKSRSPARIWNLASPVLHDYETATRSVDAIFNQLSEMRTLARHRAWRIVNPGEAPFHPHA